MTVLGYFNRFLHLKGVWRIGRTQRKCEGKLEHGSEVHAYRFPSSGRSNVTQRTFIVVVVF